MKTKHIIGGLAICNMIDITMTYHHLSAGAAELNPVVDYVLSVSGYTGVAFLKALPLLVLWLARDVVSNSSRLKALLTGTLGIYTALAAYHFLLLFGASL